MGAAFNSSGGGSKRVVVPDPGDKVNGPAAVYSSAADEILEGIGQTFSKASAELAKTFAKDRQSTHPAAEGAVYVEAQDAKAAFELIRELFEQLRAALDEAKHNPEEN